MTLVSLADIVGLNFLFYNGEGIFELKNTRAHNF